MPTTPAPEKCCSECSQPRTCQDFLKHHVKILTDTSGDSCRIFWQDFGTMNAALGCADIACQIVGVSCCSHIFGWACLRSILDMNEVCCPLCRTEWYTRGTCPESDAEPQRQVSCATIAMLYQVDVAAGRWLK